MSDRCPTCQALVEGAKRGPAWLERALAVHAQSCPGNRIRNKEKS